MAIQIAILFMVAKRLYSNGLRRIRKVKVGWDFSICQPMPVTNVDKSPRLGIWLIRSFQADQMMFKISG
jgi:hypothetical protein